MNLSHPQEWQPEAALNECRMPVFTSEFKMSRMHDFVHLLRLCFVIVWCPVVNQTHIICLCPTTKPPIDGRVRTGCCRCMHTYTQQETCKNHLSMAVMENSWAAMWKLPALAVGAFPWLDVGCSLSEAPASGMFILIHLLPWVQKLIVGECTHCAPEQLIHPTSCSWTAEVIG